MATGASVVMVKCVLQRMYEPERCNVLFDEIRKFKSMFICTTCKKRLAVTYDNKPASQLFYTSLVNYQYVICKGENQIADIKEAFPLCGGGGMQRGRGR